MTTTLRGKILEIRERIVTDQDGTRTTFVAFLEGEENGARVRIVQSIPFDGLIPGQLVEVLVRAADSGGRCWTMFFPGETGAPKVI